MEQAHLQALITEVQILKRDLKRYMSTTELEKQNLEAHVDLCAKHTLTFVQRDTKAYTTD